MHTAVWQCAKEAGTCAPPTDTTLEDTPAAVVSFTTGSDAYGKMVLSDSPSWAEPGWFAKVSTVLLFFNIIVQIAISRLSCHASKKVLIRNWTAKLTRHWLRPQRNAIDWGVGKGRGVGEGR